MPRGPRADSAGTVYHIVNRGAARRTIFETPRDFRYFASRLAYAVRREEIEIFAFSLLMTHYHLQVRSLGHLSKSLGRAQNDYSRYFNRTRKRDGPLFRGRFLSKPIRTSAHFANTYCYIDENPIQARLVSRPELWPWGSAIRLASGHPGPWLSPEARDRLGVCYGPAVPLASASSRRARAGLIEARLRSRSRGDDPLDDLLSGVPDRVWAWMIRKARLADGTAPGQPAADAEQVLVAVAAHIPACSTVPVKLPGTKRHPQSRVLTVGLLRDLAALTFAEIGRHIQRSPANAKGLHELHRRAVVELPEYGALVMAVTEMVVAPFRVHP